MVQYHSPSCIYPLYLTTQTDMGKRKVTESEGRLWAETKGYLYFETSAQSGEGVVEMCSGMSDLQVILISKPSSHLMHREVMCTSLGRPGAPCASAVNVCSRTINYTLRLHMSM